MERKKGKKVYYTIIILTIFGLLVGRLFISLNRNAKKMDKINEKIAVVEGEIDQVRDNNTKLRKKIQLLKKGPYIEKIAREQLGMVKKDEVALIKVKNSNDENREDLKEETKPVMKKISTLELCKKNIQDFFTTLFHTISIKEQ